MTEVQCNHLIGTIDCVYGFPLMYDVCSRTTTNTNGICNVHSCDTEVNHGCTYRDYVYGKECGQSTNNDSIECDFHTRWRNGIPFMYTIICTCCVNVLLTLITIGFFIFRHTLKYIIYMKVLFSLGIVILLYVIQPVKRPVCKHVSITDNGSRVRCSKISLQDNCMCIEHNEIGTRGCLYFKNKDHRSNIIDVCGMPVEDSDLCIYHLDKSCCNTEISSRRWVVGTIVVELVMTFIGSILIETSNDIMDGFKVAGVILLITNIFIGTMYTILVYNYYTQHHI